MRFSQLSLKLNPFFIKSKPILQNEPIRILYPFRSPFTKEKPYHKGAVFLLEYRSNFFTGISPPIKDTSIHRLKSQNIEEYKRYSSGYPSGKNAIRSPSEILVATVIFISIHIKGAHPCTVESGIV